MIKVLFLTRSTIYSVHGGDTVQMEYTAAYLRKLNVQVDIRSDSEDIDYNQYDLIHFFNIIRPASILFHTRQTSKPFVISPIYVDYREYERVATKGIRNRLVRLLSSDQIEYIKAIARWIVNGEKIRSNYYLLYGHRNAVKKLLNDAQLVLPNSHHEYQRLVTDYNAKNIPYHVVYNGVDVSIFQQDLTKPVKREGVICVARIEGRKNQLNLIKALNGTDIPLTIIGKPAPNHIEYYKECKKIAGNNVTFIDFTTQKELANYYQAAKVHILPSWFETTGLSSLEAAIMDCTIVITRKGDTVEYFKDDAIYCDPEDVKSIYDAIINAYEQPSSKNLKNRILEQYTWEKAAEQTLLAYKKVLNK